MFLKPKGTEQPEIPQRRLEDEVGGTETMIANGTKVHGTIQGRNSVRVAGFFEGEISTEGLVWIDKQGEVLGTVKAPGVIIEGQIKGDIDSSEKIEVRASGRVIGKHQMQQDRHGRRLLLPRGNQDAGGGEPAADRCGKEEERQRRRRAGNG